MVWGSEGGTKLLFYFYGFGGVGEVPVGLHYDQGLHRYIPKKSRSRERARLIIRDLAKYGEFLICRPEGGSGVQRSITERTDIIWEEEHEG